MSEDDPVRQAFQRALETMPVSRSDSWAEEEEHQDAMWAFGLAVLERAHETCSVCNFHGRTPMDKCVLFNLLLEELNALKRRGRT